MSNINMNLRSLHAVSVNSWQFAFDQEFLAKSPTKKKSSESPVSPFGQRSRQTDGPPKRTFALRDIVGMSPKIFRTKKCQEVPFYL